MFEQCLISQKRIRHRDPIDCAFASFVRSEIDGVGGVIENGMRMRVLGFPTRTIPTKRIPVISLRRPVYV